MARNVIRFINTFDTLSKLLCCGTLRYINVMKLNNNYTELHTYRVDFSLALFLTENVIGKDLK